MTALLQFLKANWHCLKKLGLCCLLVPYLTSCISPNDVNIKSVPLGATVYVKNPGTGKQTKLGRTPTVYKARDSSNAIVFVFELDGYVTREVIVATPYSSQSNLSVNMGAYSSAWFQSLLRTDLAKDVDAVINQLYDLPIELQNKSESEAERIIRELRPNYDNFALFHSAVGQYYYTRKNAKKAKAHFLQVLKLKPGDPEATNYLQQIDKL